MKILILTSLLMTAAAPALANDGGVASIKVKDIRMREYKYENGMEKEVQRIAKPQHRITFSGGDAAKLQQILPSQLSVVTHMQPEIKAEFDRSFKTLGIYSEKSAAVSAKVLTISCTDAELDSFGDQGKVRIIKKAQTECAIEIIGIPDGSDPSDNLGDVQEFNPKCQP